MVPGEVSEIFLVETNEEFYEEDSKVVGVYIFRGRSWDWGWDHLVTGGVIGCSGWGVLIILWVRSRWFVPCILFVLRIIR